MKTSKCKLVTICLIAVVPLITTIIISGCNRQWIDTTWNYNTAIIKSGFDGFAGKVRIKSWRDYENSDMVQITTQDGRTMLTHSANVMLVNE